MHTIEIKQCPCGYPKCAYWQLSIGWFMPGTGFSKEEAEEIRTALIQQFPEKYQ